jgi:hypothetical protein
LAGQILLSIPQPSMFHDAISSASNVLIATGDSAPAPKIDPTNGCAR